MTGEAILHVGALALTFASVSLGSYGLLRQLALLGFLPVHSRHPVSIHGELSHRLGQLAVERGWFVTLRNSVERDLLRARLVTVQADDFVGAALLNALLASVVVWGVTVAVGGAVWNLIPAAAAAFVVFQVPGWNLKAKADARIAQIGRLLPYSLEVIVLATEAGAGFEEALSILVREDPDSPLHEEFDQVLRDAQLGRKRQESLHAMAERVNTEDLTALVMALDISDELGTGLAETLKKQAEAIRASRLQRAERLAREAGPKMAVPNTMIMVANVLLILAPFLPKLADISGGM